MMRGVRQTRRPRCEDVLRRFGDQHLAPHDAGVGHPADERDGDVDARVPGSEHEDERDDQDEEREGDDDVDEAHRRPCPTEPP